ncbi:CCA tRNA nucleotidyltransferase [Companilactobacillus sp.]|jgi:tRNA nucleotidyltransferase (CCA-adding enzyme)|uniref:CCA tRNA nucleotidyltransferase n=1 Tax=Companilactobacillus sp. TaxID=2767905 RepID=UPI0025C0D9F9|nr:CCA tRNA nucleotidyltransferase [Companilactobacillus sp.]MCH4008308.1 CCA tRNA nucleotidyltransferase [Companilactobacillus sp.]MCH4051513.1 CCA tRNA nucleotidyltransferase [Companilactobacillus sp.]MCH4076251.1 CCA tRNA nucleotidyltransferase [Companilactobacillus sp.]MCH4124826.1 CCA tRNA nucleotidyltransferase [Companilactobacillus sp.]MCH4131368.1 CCA tRNA nucleotidyltransferase [Companilactobacillus sp.]
MRLEQLPKDFQKALPILKNIEEAGFEAYFVGGSVRDHILGLPIHDVDIATSAYPEEIKSIFKKTIDTGIKHGTVTVLMDDESYEITTFRTESGYQDYRRPDKVTFVRSLTDDLKRRDFTINALAVDHDGNVVDKFDGLTDLKNHLIKAVGVAEERFHEDALRMMRAVRFQSQLDFSIESKTEQAIADNAPLLEKIAVERVHEEFVKMMLGRAWKKGFKDFLRLDLAAHCPGFHDAINNLTKLLKTDDVQMLDETMVWVSIGHVLNLSGDDLNHFLRLWKVSNQVREECLATENTLNDFQSGNFDIWNIYQNGIQNIPRVEELCQLFKIQIDKDKINKSVSEIPIKNSHALKITGKDVIDILQIKPGPKIGEYMNSLEKAVVTQAVTNSYKDLQRYLLIL